MLFRPIPIHGPAATGPLGQWLARIVLWALGLVCAAIIGLSVWTAIVRDGGATPEVDACRALSDSVARLACYDRATVPQHSNPAKGAAAPRLDHGE